MLIDYHEIKPSAPLDTFVKCFWTLEKDYGNEGNHETIYPDACLDLVFTQAGNTQSAFFVGQYSTRLRLPYQGKVKSIGVRFFPFGAFPILKIPVRETTNLIIDPTTVFGNTFIDFTDLIFSLPIEEAIDEIEKFLLKRLLTGKIDIDQVKGATKLLYLSKGNIRMDLLADEVNLTPRTMERKFENITGLSPKSLSKIVRFNKIRNELTLNPFTSLTAICYQYNYFDQSHFIKDFKQLSTLTPAEFTNEVKRQRIYFYKH